MSKTILLTGARGFLGTELLEQLMKIENVKVIAFDLAKNDKILSDKVLSYDLMDWEKKQIPFNNIDYIINCAFSRSNKGQELSESLFFTKDFFIEAKNQEVKSVINISSQSLYGEPYKPLWNETTPVVNESLYAMAKYATELLTESIFEGSKTFYTNLRLASLIGAGFNQRLINKFVNSAINNEPIKIIGGNQIFSFLDVRDAADGILTMLNTDFSLWEKVYNLGHYQRYSLVQIADAVSKIAAKYNIHNVKIEVEFKEDNFDSGMDTSRFNKFTKWKPTHDLNDMIDNVFKSLLIK